MVHSIVLKFEKIWLSHTLNIIRKPKKSLFSNRKRATTVWETFFSSTHQNGEWTEISTRQKEIELAMFGEWHFFWTLQEFATNTK